MEMKDLPSWKEILTRLEVEQLSSDSKIVECDIDVMYHRPDEPIARRVTLRHPKGKHYSDVVRKSSAT